MRTLTGGRHREDRIRKKKERGQAQEEYKQEDRIRKMIT